jgi:D-lactate dehydrogenase
MSKPVVSASADSAFLDELRKIVGDRDVLTGDARTAPYRQGHRFGGGKVFAVARPATLIEQWRVLKACAAAGKIILMQAANTGLTGGSTPDGDDYDRDIVIVSTLRIRTVHLIDEGRQVVCLPGATLNQLETLLKPLGREPHSVIGSSCIGASVIGGVCNNSGGSLIQRGPAYTQLALFARINETGTVELINHLGIALGDTPESILGRLQRGDFSDADVSHAPNEAASDRDYAQRVRDIEANSPARFNADPDRLFEASGSAGKVMVFAVRLDTFEQPEATRTFYIGASSPEVLTRIRRDILGGFANLPVAAEYMHRDCYDVAWTYGKDTFLAIKYFGTQRMQGIFALKARVDAIARSLPLVPNQFADHLAQFVSTLFPEHLPRRMSAFRDRFEHHLLLKMSGPGVDEARRYLSQTFVGEDCDSFECTDDESAAAFLHRFVAAGAAVRYHAVHHRSVSGIIALDIALRRNDRDWFEVLPPELDARVQRKLYYGHFFCHVLHQDYILAPGEDPMALEHSMLELLDQRGARYPAEHNVGHLYEASPAQKGFFKKLDPCNCFNPGIGHTSRKAEWA